MSDSGPPNPLDHGYVRCFPGFFLSPGGDRVVSEADALAEIVALVNGDEEEGRE